MSLIVQKYGGTSVGTIERIKLVAKNIAKFYHQRHQLVIVVSAMSGETNRLINLALEISDNPAKRELDVIATTGEQVTIALLTMALQEQKIPSISYCGWQVPITTTNDFTQARIKTIDTTKITQNLNDGFVVVVAGFQGIATNHQITTLGRGGSDTSAVALAVALNAEECDIYTDVNGVFNADPNKVTEARRITQIDGLSMLETTSLGAKVLHVRSCELAYRYKTNVRVLSTFAPQDQGTIVMNKDDLESYPIISLTIQEEQVLVNFEYENEVYKILDKVYDICSTDMLQISNKQVNFVIEKSDLINLEPMLKTIKTIKNLLITSDLVKLSLIGSGFRSNRHLNQKVWQLMKGTEVFLTSHNEISLSMLVHAWDANTTKVKLSKLLKD